MLQILLIRSPEPGMIFISHRVKADKGILHQLSIADMIENVVCGCRAVGAGVQNHGIFPQLIRIALPAGENMHQLSVYQRIQVVNHLSLAHYRR